MSVLGDILGGAAGLAGTIYNIGANKRDFDYQRELQQQIFEREDTAIQRRMADLKAAGLNPNLAAGSPAQAGAVVSRSNTNDVNFGAAIDTMAAVQQIRNARVQNDVGKADAKIKDAEAADKVYQTMLHMGIDATPYFNKGKFNFVVHNDGIPTAGYWTDYYHGQMGEEKRQWQRNEEEFQSNMNLALSKINLDTSKISQISNDIFLSNAEFQQRVNEYLTNTKLRIQEFNFTSSLQTYQELRKQLETVVDTKEKYTHIQQMIRGMKHLDSQEIQAWTKIILDQLENPTACINLLTLLGLI